MTTKPTPAPADATLRDRLATAIRTALKERTLPPLTLYGHQASPGIGLSEYDLADVALAELATELTELADYRHRLNWHTTCGTCTRTLDSCYAETTRAEQAEATIARIRQMADAWEQQLPDTMRTAAAVDAIRTALDAAPRGA